MMHREGQTGSERQRNKVMMHRELQTVLREPMVVKHCPPVLSPEWRALSAVALAGMIIRFTTFRLITITKPTTTTTTAVVVESISG